MRARESRVRDGNLETRHHFHLRHFHQLGALPLSPVRRANSREPVAATAEGIATGTAMQQQRLIEEKERTRGEAGGAPRCWRNERKKDSSLRAGYTRPFPFPATLPLPLPTLSFRVRLSAVSSLRRANRIRNKTNPISKCTEPA